jgi:hypothetical protein
MDQAELDKRFNHYKPSETKAMRYECIRDAMQTLADIVNQEVPASREQSLAITALEEAMMWANAGIARHPEIDS